MSGITILHNSFTSGSCDRKCPPQWYIAQCVCFYSGYIFQITVAWVHEEIESVAFMRSHAVQLSTLIPSREYNFYFAFILKRFVSRYTTVIMCCSHRTTNCLPWPTVAHHSRLYMNTVLTHRSFLPF